jgi:hypothetical protein
VVDLLLALDVWRKGVRAPGSSVELKVNLLPLRRQVYQDCRGNSRAEFSFWNCVSADASAMVRGVVESVSELRKGVAASR